MSYKFIRIVGLTALVSLRFRMSDDSPNWGCYHLHKIYAITEYVHHKIRNSPKLLPPFTRNLVTVLTVQEAHHLKWSI
jgi:hypothetical protein